MNDSVLRHDAVFCWIGLDDLELNRAHTTANEESVALADGTVS